jgi:hypothetical protein
MVYLHGARPETQLARQTGPAPEPLADVATHWRVRVGWSGSLHAPYAADLDRDPRGQGRHDSDLSEFELQVGKANQTILITQVLFEI